MTAEPLTEALRETLALFDGGGVPRTTPEIADRLDLGRRSTYERLERLVEHGRLETKTVGASARVWWRPPTAATAVRASGREWSAAAESLLDDVLDGAEVGVFVLDDDFEVAWINEATERYFGLDRGEVLDRDKRALVGEEIAPVVGNPSQFANTVLATYSDNTYAERFECHVTAGEGREPRWLEHRSKPIESGAYAGGRVELYYDVTDRKRVKRSQRQDREQFESFLEAVEEYAIVMLDPEGTVRTWNAGAERIKGYDADGIVGEHVSTFYTDEDRAAGVPEGNLAAAAADGVAEAEGYWERADGSRFWGHVTITAIRDGDGTLDGYAVVTRDMTERRENERRLERQAAQLERQRDDLESELEDVFDRVDDGFYALDDEWQFTYVNDRAEALLGLEESRVVGRDIRGTVSLTDDFREGLEEALDGQEPVSLEDYYESLDAWFENTLYPSETGVSVYFRDVTDRKERERRLEESEQRYRTLAENFPNGGVAFFDDELRHTLVEGQGFEKLDFSASDLRGERVQDVYSGDVLEVIEPNYRAALEGERNSFDLDVQGRTFEFRSLPLTTDDGTVYAGMSMSQDVTERKERERQLRDAKLQLEAAAEAGAVGTWEWRVPEDRMVTGPTFARLFGIAPDAAREGVSLDQFISAIHGDDRERVERAVEEAVANRGEYEEEYRVRDADDELRWVLARGHVRTDDDGEPTTFPGALVDITERKRAEEELEHQREQLAALNGLNDIVRDITDAVIDQSSRAEIEETVCAHLADSDSYLFAWIGDVDTRTQTVELRTEAGVEGYLDDLTVSVDPDDERGLGPTGRALLNGEVQTARDIGADDLSDLWRRHADEYGFRSSAAIPIVHEDTVYGVLNVYAERPDAFEGPERTVVAQLGEVVGHAIAAVDRKRALLSDEIVELQFRIRDVFDASGLDSPLAGSITLDHFVPIEDDEYLVFGSAAEDAVDGVEAIVEAIPHWEDVTFRNDGSGTSFELRLSEPPVLSTVASLGGSVETAVIEEGDYRMTIHLAPNADVGRVIDAVRASYPDVDMLKRSQISRPDDAAERVRNVLASDLTDRQRTALEAAYHAGFFEWPREAAGEDVAASLDVSSSTFHQHLRKAERKVFDSLLSRSAPT